MKLYFYIWGLVLLFLITGCGNKVTVSGRVTFADGEPLSTGRVVFENDQFFYYGNLKKDGTFSIGVLKDGTGIPLGKYRVAVEYAFATTPDGQPTEQLLIAEKHANTKTSGLEYDIQKRTTDIHITVEKPEPKKTKRK
ncbi:MAG: carboxypeptidase-like regulatory domain-containing protein [Planctomycetaceae bacterium]|jgi:hypothetical protein|nr:carboxypeptidase-like regulatory domain-containing protein [Planctomycetaceae bacterium]